MTELGCHAVDETPRHRAKTLILKTLGAKRVAAWCGVAEDTVYQWLGRGTDERPIPTDHVAAIRRGAAAEGLDAPLDVLWPEIAGGGQ
jgi:transposase